MVKTLPEAFPASSWTPDSAENQCEPVVERQVYAAVLCLYCHQDPIETAIIN